MSKGFSRRILALAAAYAVALQALLLPLSIAAGNPFGSSLCTSAIAAENSQSPVNKDQGCPCAGGCGMQCCSHTLAGPPHVAVVPERTITGAARMLPVPVPAIRSADRTPQVPRAPPAA